MYTTQKQVRRAFWQDWRVGYFKPLHVTPRRITDYSGNGIWTAASRDEIASLARAIIAKVEGGKPC